MKFQDRLIQVRLIEIRQDFAKKIFGYFSNRLVIAPARRAGDPGSIPGPGENFFS